MKFLLVGLSLLLFSCAGSKPESEEETVPGIGAEACLEKPELAKAWGECNVKKTIYDRRVQIASCVKENKGKKESVLNLKLQPDGKVKEVEFEESAKYKRAVPCLKKEFSKLKFAAPPKGVNPVIMYPMEF